MFTKWLPSIIAALLSIFGVFVAPVQDYVAAHPAIAAVVAGVGAIVAHILPSPREGGS